jgi:hypothetical protein
MAAKLTRDLPKLVVKMGPEHGLALEPLLKALKSDAALVRAIHKWHHCLNSTVLVRFVSLEGLLLLCLYYEKLRGVQNQINEVLTENAQNRIQLSAEDRVLVRLCAHVAWDSSVQV